MLGFDDGDDGKFCFKRLSSLEVIPICYKQNKSPTHSANPELRP